MHSNLDIIRTTSILLVYQCLRLYSRDLFLGSLGPSTVTLMARPITTTCIGLVNSVMLMFSCFPDDDIKWTRSKMTEEVRKEADVERFPRE